MNVEKILDETYWVDVISNEGTCHAIDEMFT